MKKYLISLIIIIIITGASWYVWTGREGVRTYYKGYVQIESASMESIIGKLENVGCTPEGRTCHYIYNTEKNVLVLNPFAKGEMPYGPAGGFKIEDGKLYTSFDISGRRNQKRFETAVRDAIKKYGNAVVPIEGTWTITDMQDRTGVVY